MQLSNNRPSIDGVHRPVKRKPDLRPDHDLPAPEPTPLLEDHPEKMLESGLGLVGPGGEPKKRSLKKWLFIGIGVILTLIVAIVTVAFVWYQAQLAPVSSDKSKHIRVTIVSGSAPSTIASQLEEAGVIRSSFAFGIYTKLSGTENSLKAGTFNLQPSQSTPEIVKHLVEGKEDTFRVTFLPGETLANNRKVLLKLGYSEAEVDAAFNKQYDRPLFATKPTDADLEGYIFGETLEFSSAATVEDILNGFFTYYESVINEHNLVERFKKQGLTLYEGITLASIVQREMPYPDDQRHIARVFFNRMKAGMNLGSDVTYQYAADKEGRPRDPRLDSPYNTRIHTGLPPGPIATPGESALLAVANPADNDYIFFLSGDDNKTYYGKTEEQHQKNIVNHCQKKCQIL